MPNHRRLDIAIFGSGAWGTALAMTWARQGAHVALWGHPPEAVRELEETRRHPRLPGAELPPNVVPLSDPEPAFHAPIWISALPTQISGDVWQRLAVATTLRPELLIHVSKGLLQVKHQRLSEALGPILGVPIGVLSGPSFADEVARELPTAIVLALPPEIEEERARQIQALLATPRLRLYLSRDIAGVELCGALKNTLAIAAGLVEALGFGNNARAALLTRGLAEMTRLVEKLGGRSETATGLAGMGDLLLTATGPQSRNRRFGEMVGRGTSPADATASMGEQVVEGVYSTEAALSLAKHFGIELPITLEVARLIKGADPQEAVKRLMQRSLKSE
ncbi:MAG: NAD(P)-dependent glycerol-3-phosphate dehydrogenase [Holophaga sp.]|nr:NAD(P)-dependent glycerol-3-phosphate dehydrogenase [Holophaga sp.]